MRAHPTLAPRSISEPADLDGGSAGADRDVTRRVSDEKTRGDVYKLTANAAHVVTGCTKNNVADTLPKCLANSAYTSFFKFTTDRVIAK
jgi:hypothetical protein